MGQNQSRSDTPLARPSTSLSPSPSGGAAVNFAMAPAPALDNNVPRTVSRDRDFKFVVLQQGISTAGKIMALVFLANTANRDILLNLTNVMLYIGRATIQNTRSHIRQIDGSNTLNDFHKTKLKHKAFKKSALLTAMVGLICSVGAWTLLNFYKSNSAEQDASMSKYGIYLSFAIFLQILSSAPRAYLTGIDKQRWVSSGYFIFAAINLFTVLVHDDIAGVGIVNISAATTQTILFLACLYKNWKETTGANDANPAYNSYAKKLSVKATFKENFGSTLSVFSRIGTMLIVSLLVNQLKPTFSNINFILSMLYTFYSGMASKSAKAQGAQTTGTSEARHDNTDAAYNKAGFKLVLPWMLSGVLLMLAPNFCPINFLRKEGTPLSSLGIYSSIALLVNMPSACFYAYQSSKVNNSKVAANGFDGGAAIVASALAVGAMFAFKTTDLSDESKYASYLILAATSLVLTGLADGIKYEHHKVKKRNKLAGWSHAIKAFCGCKVNVADEGQSLVRVPV